MTTRHRSFPRSRLVGISLTLAAGIVVSSASLTDAAAPARSPFSEAGDVSVIGLRQGAQGPGVLAVQQALIGFGYYVSGGADGTFGSGTTAALEVFQGQNGLNPTGVVTENTARYLGLSAGAPATPGAPAAPADPAPPSNSSSVVGLRRGATGANVRLVQTQILATGLVISGGADGTFGASTERMVKVVQRVNGLPETGVVDARTAQVLGITGSASSPTTPAPAGTAVQYGAQGPTVKRIQNLLINAGYTVRGGADGIFGSATRSAVRQFQQFNGLSVTGQVDAATDEALVRAAGSSDPQQPSTSSAAAIAINAAMSQLKVPYRYGLAAPGFGFDCSGLTAWAWRRAGVELPYHSGLQYAVIPHVAVADARPGDLLFFHSPISHVGMYLGNGQMIDAARPGTVVKVRPVMWSAVVGVGRPG